MKLIFQKELEEKQMEFNYKINELREIYEKVKKFRKIMNIINNLKNIVGKRKIYPKITRK